MPKTGDIISLRADTGMWMARCGGCAPPSIEGKYRDNLMAHVRGQAAGLPDYATFEVESVGDGKVTLRSVDSRLYVGRCNGCYKDAVYANSVALHVESGSPAYARFKVRVVGQKLTLQADNGLYVGRCRDCYAAGAKIDSIFAHGKFSDRVSKPIHYLWTPHFH